MAYLGEQQEQKPIEEEEKRRPQTLWDLFMDYLQDKDKQQEKKFVEVV